MRPAKHHLSIVRPALRAPFIAWLYDMERVRTAMGARPGTIHVPFNQWAVYYRREQDAHTAVLSELAEC